MANKESTFKNMVLALFIVTIIAASTLGSVHELTKAPIDQAKLNKKLSAIKEVVPEFSNNPDAERYKLPTDGDSITVYPAKNTENKLVGVAIETFTMNGFSGLIKIMVGFTPDGTIYNYQVLEHKETPGLGTKMMDWFKPKVVEESGKKSRNKFLDHLFGIKSGEESSGNVVVGKNPSNLKLKVSKDGGDVDAITAATITSRAFCDAIQRAYDAYTKENKTQGGKDE